MRDPDLVFRAQLAAAALEGAWHRWRVVHGLAADPMPTVSSYVGYSLDEPWGQPRVVFGLAAEDAEQLAALLERHDCVGPVYAAVATLPGPRDDQRRTGPRRAPLPVPRQAPSAVAEQPEPDEEADDSGDYDEPVFRQAAAAMAEVAAARDSASHADRPDGIGDLDELGVTADEDEDAGPPYAAGRYANAGPTDPPVPDEGALPGSLAQAASAARAEAEARIKAALTEYRALTAHDHPYPTVGFDIDDPVTPGPAGPEIHATDVLEPLPRPEAASGAYSPLTDDVDQMSDFEMDPDPGDSPDLAPEGSGTTGMIKRSRVRGYPLPRLPRTKRQGAVPGS
jgi:hypothetical protein